MIYQTGIRTKNKQTHDIFNNLFLIGRKPINHKVRSLYKNDWLPLFWIHSYRTTNKDYKSFVRLLLKMKNKYFMWELNRVNRLLNTNCRYSYDGYTSSLTSCHLNFVKSNLNLLFQYYLKSQFVVRLTQKRSARGAHQSSFYSSYLYIYIYMKIKPSPTNIL